MAQHGYLREYDEGWDRGDDRDRWRDEDRERGWRGERDFRDRNRDRNFMFGGADPLRSNRWQDEHYLSWRNKQVEALDRDYAEYLAEREQQFHQDFDSWRRNRRSNPQPLQAGMTGTGLSQEPTDTLELTNEARADPMSAATLGTTSSRSGRR